MADHQHRRAARLIVLGLPAILGACAGSHDDDFSGVVQAERAVDGPPTSPPPVSIGDEVIGWETLRPLLAEAAGGAVIEEVILDHQVRAELARQGLRVSADDVAQERTLLARTLERNAGAGAEDSARLIARLQETRGLGPRRFQALLERNAMLRRLVQGGVEVSPADVERALSVRYGQRVRCRIIVVPTNADAVRVLARLNQSPENLPERFAAEARLVSVDPSGPAGGLVAPISPEDPSYAVAVLQAARGLRPGELSPIIGLDNGCAILLGEGTAPAEEPPPGARDQVEADLRLRQERIAMDRLAQRLLNSAPAIVFDPALGWSWRVRMTGAGGR